LVFNFLPESGRNSPRKARFTLITFLLPGTEPRKSKPTFSNLPIKGRRFPSSQLKEADMVTETFEVAWAESIHLLKRVL
jgi:hypothetical protein